MRVGLLLERKKIMFFIYRMGGGGAARTMLNIINHIDRTRFEPILVTLQFTYNYEQYVKKDVRFIKLQTNRLRKAIVPLARLLRKERPDILFSTVPNYNTIAILAKLLSRVKTKLIVREAAYLGGTWKENMKLKFYGLLYRFSTHVVALSEGVKQNLMKRYHIKEKKITVIYNPVDLAHIQQQSKQQLSEPDIYDKGEPVIITAGRFVKEKDHATLLRAFQRVNESMEAQLVLLGEGELEESLKEQARELKLAERVHFLGFQQNPYKFLKRAQVFVLTSTTEGFGHVLVEALALGIPVVSTRCNPGAKEILGEAEYGRLADVGDSDEIAEQLLHVLSQSENDRKKTIAKGKERAMNFDALQIVNEYERLFLHHIEGKSQ